MNSTPATSAYDSDAYLRGWAASDEEQAALISPMESPAMDAADDREEPREWFEGFSDHAEGNPQFHFRDCTACVDGEGVCPVGA